MSASLSTLGVLAGLAALAGIFFLLQRLKVRQRPLTVETTLFWQQAIEEARARVLVQRFRHPWVYVLLLTIASCIWLAFAGLEGGRNGDRGHLVLIDGSAAMAGGDRFSETIDLVEEYVAGLDSGLRTVVFCGGRPRTILGRGEDVHLLRERLADRAPEAAPPSIERAIRQLLPARRGPLTVCIAGDAQLTDAFHRGLPEGVEVIRLAPGSTPGPRAGIVALGATPAISGAWDKVDVLVETRSTTGDAPAPTLEIDQLVWDGVVETTSEDAARRTILRDVPARGELVTARIASGDEQPRDAEAQLVLPNRVPMKVVLGAGVPPSLRRALEADPAVVLVTSGADLAVRSVDEPVGEGLPALEIATESSQANAILVAHREGRDSIEVLTALHGRLGLSEIDASDVTRAGEAPVTMGAAPAEQRGIRIWDSLLGDEFNFARSRAFPLFVALSMRWLDARQDPPESAAVGELLALSGDPVHAPSGTRFASLGDAFRPTRAGLHTTESGVRFSPSLLDPGAYLSSADAASIDEAQPDGGGVSLMSVLVLLAMGLLLCEWVLFRLGRIP